MAFWLAKTDPDSYSWDNFVADGVTVWDGIRNYQARNNLKEMKIGDTLLMYHSQSDKSIIGLASVTKEHFPDPTIDDDRWVAVEIKAGEKLKNPLTLDKIRLISELANIGLLKQSRLSVIKITDEEFDVIMRLTQ